MTPSQNRTVARTSRQGVSIDALIERHRYELSAAERRVADVVLAQPELVAFGTVARVAAAANTSAASVVRLAARLGLPGFNALQAGVQHAVSAQLRPAADKIRSTRSTGLIGRTLALETNNLAATLENVNQSTLDRTVHLLANQSHHIWVLAGDAQHGVAEQFTSLLTMTRPGVRSLDGPTTRIGRLLAELEPGDVVIAIDLRRYEQWVLESVELAKKNGAHIIAVTDRQLSPLAGMAEACFVVHAEGSGPYDSHIGTLAVLQLLVSALSARVRPSAHKRLNRIEAAWNNMSALADN